MSDEKALADRQAELADMFALFNETTQKLELSHDALQREVARLRGELAEKNAELARKRRLAALGEMAAGMAHEIRNPLGGIQLYTSLLERDLDDGGPKELVRKIDVGIKNLNGIVEGILAFAREETPDIAPCRIEEVIVTALEILSPQADRAGVRVVTEFAASDPIPADARLLERAVSNVIQNAIQASEAGGAVVVRTRRSEREGRAVCIDVVDSGSGISPDALEKIFNPFFTSKATGTGLGLAIVHRIVESHGGSISAGNNAAGGATFTIRLPGGVAQKNAKREVHAR